jgi:FtsH-binding integral membrane protein
VEDEPFLAVPSRSNRARGRQLIRHKFRSELYGLLCMAGAVIVFFVFVGIASNYFPGPDWLWYVVGFVGLFWTEFLIHKKFDSSRLRSRI